VPVIETNGIRMFYTESGAREPVLLIMGITATGAVWEKHAGYWHNEFRCILPDNRGVGQTDKPPGPYTSAMMAADCVGLLDALSISKARVVGCSMGSIVAQEMMLNHPERVQSAVLMCPWARVDRYASGIFSHMVHSKARLTPEEFATFIQLLIFSKAAWDNTALYKTMLYDRRGAGLDPNPQPLFALEAQAAACVTHDALKRLRNVRCPCLVIGGGGDIFTPAWMAKEIAATIPRCDLHLYESAGHAFHWEHLDDFNERVLAWLRAH
jgi:pimeloyl-ACP methyl ester carboxylesterase